MSGNDGTVARITLYETRLDETSDQARDPEMQAMETICATLAPLDTAACQRILSEVAWRFGITLTPLGET
jgi:hypothetical protein